MYKYFYLLLAYKIMTAMGCGIILWKWNDVQSYMFARVYFTTYTLKDETGLQVEFNIKIFKVKLSIVMWS